RSRARARPRWSEPLTSSRPSATSTAASSTTCSTRTAQVPRSCSSAWPRRPRSAAPRRTTRASNRGPAAATIRRRVRLDPDPLAAPVGDGVLRRRSAHARRHRGAGGARERPRPASRGRPALRRWQPGGDRGARDHRVADGVPLPSLERRGPPGEARARRARRPAHRLAHTQARAARSGGFDPRRVARDRLARSVDRPLGARVCARAAAARTRLAAALRARRGAVPAAAAARAAATRCAAAAGGGAARRLAPRRAAARGRPARRRCRPPAAARAAATAGRALRRRDLRGDHGLRELRDQLLEVGGHALLVATDRARELGRVLVAHGLGERLDRRVRCDLLGLLGELGLRVLEFLLGLARSAEGVQRALAQSDRLLRGGGCGGGDAVLRATQLLDATLDLARVRLGLLEVLLQTLLIRRTVRHTDVRLERGLEFLLLAVRLGEVLHELRVALVEVGHVGSLPSLRAKTFTLGYPNTRALHTTGPACTPGNVIPVR